MTKRGKTVESFVCDERFLWQFVKIKKLKYFLGEDMSIVGHIVLFFLAGFVQFNYIQNKGGFAAVLFLCVLLGGIYFLGWWAILTFVIGAMAGSKVCFAQR